MERLSLIVLLSLLYCCNGQQPELQNDPTKTMPLSYFKSSGLYNAMGNNTKFIDKFLNDYTIDGVTTEVRFSTKDKRVKHIGSVDVAGMERADLATTITHAGCDPYEQIVNIPNDKSNVLLYPSCVVLKQCGGCCGHPSLACKPTSTQDKIVQVMKYVYDGSQAHPVKNIDYAQLEEHTACECQCRLTQADCNTELHSFDDWDCKCMCQKKKKNCGDNKRWDENICACRCSSVQNCGTGFRYNMVECSCEEDAARSDSPGPDNPVISQPDRVIEETITVDPCGHLNCPRYYKTQVKKGICVCKFDRDAYNRNN